MNMDKIEKIAVVIPCYNEAKGIAKVIEKFPYHRFEKLGFKIQVFVIDNDSTDNTAEIAANAGATVLSEPKKGKGNALRAGFQNLPQDIDYVVMLDGDDTYSPKELLRMIEPLHSGFCDAVVGSRLSGRIHGDSMTFFNQVGNWIFTHLVRYIYRANVTDVLTGYFAWKKDAIDQLYPHLTSEGFAIEMEMITKMARLGLNMYSVPISYTQRAGDSNLRPIKDGYRIMRMFLQNLTWKPSRIYIRNTHSEKTGGLDVANMHILIVAHHYPPHISGIGNVAYKQAEQLAKKNAQVTVLTTNCSDKAGVTEHKAGYVIQRLRALNIFEDKMDAPFPLFSPTIFWHAYKHVKKSDIIHIHDVFYMSSQIVGIMAILQRKPFYITQHVGLVDHPSKLVMTVQKVVYQTFGKLLFKRSNGIIVYNANVKEFITSLGIKTPKIIQNYNGIDTQYFSPYSRDKINELKEKYNFPTTKPIVLFVGRLVPKKGFDLVFKSKSEEYLTLIVGNGRVPVHMKNNKDVVFFGPATQAQLLDLYRLSDVFVLPAVGEVFTLVMQEAMACGLPTITTNDNAYLDYDILHDLIGFTERDTTSIKSIIYKILNDDNLYKKMSDYSRQLAITNFSWEQNYPNEFDLYEDIS